MKRFVIPTIAAIVAATLAAPLSAQTDTTLTYQGALVESGIPANGSFNMDFSLWDEGVGGNQVGSTLVKNGVQTVEGKFVVELEFGAGPFDNSDRWLEIAVEGVTLSPRTPITRAPYAIQTRGLFVDDADRVGIGTASPQNVLHVESNATNNIAIYGHTADFGGMGVLGEASYPGSFNAGVRGVSHSSVGNGVWGDAMAGGYGVNGTSSGEFARGVSGEGYGAQAKGVSGTGGLYGVFGQTGSSPVYGVYGLAYGSGVTHGVYGKSQSSSGRGLYGYASHSSGGTYGVVGQVDSPAGYAAYFIGPVGSQNYFSRDVGINTLSPGYLLHVNGSAGKPGGGSWSNSSDRRLKKNINDLQGSLNKLMKLRGVTFEYLDPKAINELDGERIGVIAQEVEKIFPDWVNEREDGYKAVTFRGFEALTVEALRELRQEKDRQLAERDAEIARQKEEISELANRLEAIPREMTDIQQESEAMRERLAALESLVQKLAADTTEKQH